MWSRPRRRIVITGTHRPGCHRQSDRERKGTPTTTPPLVRPAFRSTTITIRRAVVVLVIVAAIALAFAIGRVTADEASAGPAPHTTTRVAAPVAGAFDGCHF